MNKITSTIDYFKSIKKKNVVIYFTHFDIISPLDFQLEELANDYSSLGVYFTSIDIDELPVLQLPLRVACSNEQNLPLRVACSNEQNLPLRVACSNEQNLPLYKPNDTPRFMFIQDGFEIGTTNSTNINIVEKIIQNYFLG